MLTITYPTSAAWNEAIRPAVDAAASTDAWESILEGIASQLAAGIAPESLSLGVSGKDEKAKLVAVGAKFVLEAILQAAPPGVNEDAVLAALTQRAPTAGAGEPVGRAAAATAATVWVRHAKKAMQSQRARAIDEICHRTTTSTASTEQQSQQQPDEDANVLRYLSAEVRICQRSVGEEEQEPTANAALFEPVANFAIAPEEIDVVRNPQQQQGRAQHQPAGTMLSLNAKQTYELLCEIDTIQRRLDALRG